MHPLANTFNQASLDCNDLISGSIKFFIFLEDLNSVLNLSAIWVAFCLTEPPGNFVLQSLSYFTIDFFFFWL